MEKLRLEIEETGFAGKSLGRLPRFDNRLTLWLFSIKFVL